MKRFIGYISQQSGAYEKTKYRVVDCPVEMDYGETRMPLMPLLNAYVVSEESIEVILVSTIKRKDENESEHKQESIGETAFERNKRYAEEELNEWARQKKVDLTITYIEQEEQTGVNNCLWLFEQLIQAIEHNWTSEDVFYADITYGLKPMTLVMLYALRYVRSVKKNHVKSIVYGMFIRISKDHFYGELYDLISLFHMDSMIANLGEMNLPGSTEVIHTVLHDALYSKGD